jgi:signal transduction histidine kinase
MGTSGIGPFNLGPRLTITFATLIMLILGGNALVVWQFQIIRNETDRLTGANEQLIAVLRLQANVLSFHRRLDDLARSMDVHRLVTGTESLRRTLREQIQQTRIAIVSLPSGTDVNPSFLPTLDTIDVALPGEIDPIVELAKSGDWVAIQPRVANELSPNEDQTAILVDSINQQVSGELARAVAERRSIQRRILIIVPATALSTFFMATFFGWSIARRFIELRLEERVNERTRIAQELHDTLLQSFQGLMLRFQTIDIMLPGQPTAAKKALAEVLDRADDALNESRCAIQNIRSSASVASNFPQALNGVMSKMAEECPSQRPECSVVIEGSPKLLNPWVDAEILRIAQESLRNSFQHARATRIETEVTFGESNLRVRIRDNGMGIDPEILRTGSRMGHWGMIGMKERAAQIGAKLDIWSKLGAGTELDLNIPGQIAYGRSKGKNGFRLLREWLERRHERSLSEPESTR